MSSRASCPPGIHGRSLSNDIQVPLPALKAPRQLFFSLPVSSQEQDFLQPGDEEVHIPGHAP